MNDWMPPAAKKKKLRRTTSSRKEPVFVTKAVVRCKHTNEYVEASHALTFVSARNINRMIGTTKWYRMNKDTLIANIVLHQFVKIIQRFFRDTVTMSDRVNGSMKKIQQDCSHMNKVCPISLTPMSEIPPRYRFKHTNTWFNRDILREHMSVTSDFVNPVTRVEFQEEDVLKIDPSLIEQFKNRKELRSSIAEDMAMVQSVENELEEIFQNMVEAAEEIPLRMEFRIVFEHLSEDFQECHGDLIDLDYDRSNLAIKSLYDVIRGDPNNPVRMSRKRENILKHFLDSQV